MEADGCKDRSVRAAQGLEGLAKHKKVKNVCSQNAKAFKRSYEGMCILA